MGRSAGNSQKHVKFPPRQVGHSCSTSRSLNNATQARLFIRVELSPDWLVFRRLRPRLLLARPARRAPNLVSSSISNINTHTRTRTHTDGLYTCGLRWDAEQDMSSAWHRTRDPSSHFISIMYSAGQLFPKWVRSAEGSHRARPSVSVVPGVRGMVAHKNSARLSCLVRVTARSRHKP